MTKYYQEEVEQYKQTKAQAKSQQITDMPVAHGNNTDLSDYIVKLDEMYDKVYTNLIKAENMKTNIMVWCESLENLNERLVLMYRYIQGHTFGWISEQMYFSERSVSRIHNKAIEHLPEPDFINLWV